MPEPLVEITKTGEDHYYVFSNDQFLHIEEDVNGPALMGMTGLSSAELLTLFDMKPIGHKVTVRRK